MAERRYWVEVVLMPIVVATVGIFGTYQITKVQEDSALIASDAQRASAIKAADADRQVKILEIFASKITSDDLDQRKLALRLLESIDPQLATRLAAAAVAEEPPDSPLRAVAKDVSSRAADCTVDNVDFSVFRWIGKDRASGSYNSAEQRLIREACMDKRVGDERTWEVTVKAPGINKATTCVCP